MRSSERCPSNSTIEGFFAVIPKLAVIESELTPAELAEGGEYERHKREAERPGHELQEFYDDFAEIVDTFRDTGRNSK